MNARKQHGAATMYDAQTVWVTVIDNMPERVFPTYEDAAADRRSIMIACPGKQVRITVANFWSKAPSLNR
jgi:hypothetical protein